MKRGEPLERGNLPTLRARDATPDEIAAVLHASHSVRGGGMSPDDSLAYDTILRQSPWGRERCRFIVGIAAAGTIGAALKLFSLEGRLHGRRVRIAGIGDLFTPPERRGRRFGAALLETVLAGARDDRAELALLLSDIEVSYFLQLGFSVLPGGEASCVTVLPAPWPHEPAWVGEADPPAGVPGLRLAAPDDLDHLTRLHDRYESSGSFRLVRERMLWDHLLLKAFAGRRLGGEGETVIWMIDERAAPAAYAILRVHDGTLRWLEHGTRRGADHLQEVLFWAAIAMARRRGLARLEGWSLPHGAEGKPLYPIARRTRRRPILMARALEPGLSLSDLHHETDCRIGEFERF